MWASVGGVLASQKREPTAEESATADRVCAACAVWDGSPEALGELRFGDDWRVTMAVISRGEPCWADVMRVCDAIVRDEGYFMAASGHIYTTEMILRHGGKVRDGRLVFPDKAGMYQDGGGSGFGDPWEGMHERAPSWRSGR